MTHEEIVKKAGELFPDELIKGEPSSVFISRASERKAYIKGCEDTLASLPRIKAWLARDTHTKLYTMKPSQTKLGYYTAPNGFIITDTFLEYNPDKPIEVELLIVKK